MLDGDKLDLSVVGSSVVVGRTDADLARLGEAIVFRPCGCSIRQSEWRTSAAGKNGVSPASMDTNCSKIFFFCSKFFWIVCRTVLGRLRGSASAGLLCVISATASWMA